MTNRYKVGFTIYEEFDAKTKKHAQVMMWNYIRDKFPDNEIWPAEIIELEEKET